MRILAHLAEVRALEIYQTDPRADFHEVAARLVNEVSGLSIKRKQAKITGFSLVYGAGIQALAIQLGVFFEDARAINNAFINVLPCLADLMDTFTCIIDVRTSRSRMILAHNQY